MLPALIIIVACYTLVRLLDMATNRNLHPFVFWMAIAAIVITAWQVIEVLYAGHIMNQDMNNIKQFLQ